eukprot:Pgem_evm1s13412
MEKMVSRWTFNHFRFIFMFIEYLEIIGLEAENHHNLDGSLKPLTLLSECLNLIYLDLFGHLEF